MSLEASRRFLSLAAIYAVNQLALFVTFKVSAEVSAAPEHVALLTIHSVGSFVSQLADLGYSRPAYRNIARMESLSAQADYFFRVNLQRAIILAAVLPVVLAFTTFENAAPAAVIVLACCYVTGVALRSQWIFASHGFFGIARALEFASGGAMIGVMLLIYVGVIEPRNHVILAALALMRLAPLVLLSLAIFEKTSSARSAFVLDKEVFTESFVSTGIKAVLLFAHYSNAVLLLGFFAEAEVSDYLHAEKLFYAGLGVFAFAASDLIRLAARGVFSRLPWYWLAASVFAVTSVIVLILMQFSEFAVRIAFSEAYVSAARPLNWMLASFPFFAANVVVGNAYLSRREHDRLNLVCCAISSLGNIGVVAWAVLTRQPDVAAFGILASEALGLVTFGLALTLFGGPEGTSTPRADAPAPERVSG